MQDPELVGLEPLVRLVRRGTAVRAVGAVVLVGAGAVMMHLCGGSPIEIILSSLPAVAGALLGLAAVERWDPLRSPIMELVVRTPQRIVWFYADDLEGAVTRNVYLQRGDGSSVAIADIPVRDVPDVMKVLRHKLRHAVVGYSETTRRRYGTNPRMVAVQNPFGDAHVPVTG